MKKNGDIKIKLELINKIKKLDIENLNEVSKAVEACMIVQLLKENKVLEV